MYEGSRPAQTASPEKLYCTSRARKKARFDRRSRRILSISLIKATVLAVSLIHGLLEAVLKRKSAKRLKKTTQRVLF